MYNYNKFHLRIFNYNKSLYVYILMFIILLSVFYFHGSNYYKCGEYLNNISLTNIHFESNFEYYILFFIFICNGTVRARNKCNMSAAAESGTISNLAIIITLRFLSFCKNKLQLNTFITQIANSFGDNNKLKWPLHLQHNNTLASHM